MEFSGDCIVFSGRPQICQDDHYDSFPIIYKLQCYFDTLSDALPLDEVEDQVERTYNSRKHTLRIKRKRSKHKHD